MSEGQFLLPDDESGTPTRMPADEVRARLAAIAESSDDAIIGKDLSGIVTAWNRAAEFVFGYTAGEIIGRPITTIIPPERTHEEAVILERVRRGERMAHFEAVRQGKDGGIVPVSLTVSPIRDANGTIVGACKIARDLSDKQQANEELQRREALLRSILDTVPDALIVINERGLTQSFSVAAEGCSLTGFLRDLTERQERERRVSELQSELIHISRLNELGQMVSALAHEVNQPLTAMANYLGGMRRLLAAGNQQGAELAMQRIAEQADRARQVIQRLKDLVKKGEAERRVESLSKIIEGASALALVGVGQGLRLNIHVPAVAAEAVIDKVQIRRVPLNLMHNAAEAMADSARRELSVTTARLGEMVEISVADTGPGLPESVRTRLFEPFVTPKPTGLGVGLSVCRAIIEAHGGELRAADAEGGGTVFSLTVPHPEGSCQRSA